jgi:hypothetical protein
MTTTELYKVITLPCAASSNFSDSISLSTLVYMILDNTSWKKRASTKYSTDRKNNSVIEKIGTGLISEKYKLQAIHQPIACL